MITKCKHSAIRGKTSLFVRWAAAVEADKGTNMSYEAWRISYKSSEQAARAAYVEWKNLLGARPEKERDMQDQLMKFDPTNRTPHPYPSHAAQYRKWHGLTAWLYNPWTGAKRDPRDIGSDVQGLLIAPSDDADECPGCGPDLGPCVCVKVPG